MRLFVIIGVISRERQYIELILFTSELRILLPEISVFLFDLFKLSDSLVSVGSNVFNFPAIFKTLYGST